MPTNTGRLDRAAIREVANRCPNTQFGASAAACGTSWMTWVFTASSQSTGRGRDDDPSAADRLQDGTLVSLGPGFSPMRAAVSASGAQEQKHGEHPPRLRRARRERELGED